MKKDLGIQPFSDYDLLPAYVRVADDLRSKLGSPGFEFGKFLPGEYEIAAQYQLSRGTIRKALSILESEGLLSRQPGRGTIILHPVEQNKLDKAKIAVVWTMVRWMGMEMFSQLEDSISQANCEIVFFSSQHDFDKEIEILSDLQLSDVQGVILYSTGHPGISPLIRKIEEHGKPIILLDRFILDQEEQSSWVTSDNEQGAYEVTKHLIDLGHKRIVMSVLTPEHQMNRINTLVERERGYQRAMKEAGLECMVRKVCNVTEDFKDVVGQELIDFINSYQPTAIFFHNDVSAYRMYTILNQNGIRVPDDISIAGFDGIHLLDEVLLFELTTVEQDFANMGRRAGQAILSMVRNPTPKAIHVRVPVHLRIGDTTGPPRKDADTRKIFTAHVQE